VLLATVACFAWLKSYALSPALSDEPIYFYDAWLMSRGFVPYRDFFFAHPPLHLVPGWLLLSVMGGFRLLALKLMAPAAALVAGIGVHAVTRHAVRAGRREAGPLVPAIAAWASLSLFLFSYDLLRASSHWTGVNCALAWLGLGTLFALRGRALAAGGLLALGSCTAVYVTPVALVCVVCLAVARPRAGLRCGAALLGTWLAVNLLFLGLGGQGYLDGVYRYHFLKSAAGESGLGNAMGELLFHNFFVLAAPLFHLPFLIAGLRRRQRDRVSLRAAFDPAGHPLLATGLWCTAIWLVGILFITSLGRVFHYYFLIVFPAATVCGGLFVFHLIEALRAARREPRARVVAATACLALFAGWWGYPRFEHALPYFAKNEGRARQYARPVSPLPGSLQWLFGWEAERVVGRRYGAIQYYLWHESRTFDELHEIADALRRLAAPGDRIFGDSTSTPLVALLAGVEIADRFVDTNGMRFAAGLPRPEEAIARLEAAIDREDEPLTWLLLNPRRGVARVEPMRRFFESRFEIVERFPTQHHGTYRLMRIRGISESSRADGRGAS